MSCDRLVTVLLAWASVLTAASGAGAQQPSTAWLAKWAPPDARLFLEVSDIQAFFETRAGLEFAELLESLIPRPSTQPASQAATQAVSTWQEALAARLGLRNPAAARMLFTGRIAVAADGWRTIGDAVLLAQPADSSALEKELEASRIPDGAEAKVRRYRLDSSHELVCDGRVVAIGVTGPYGLYHRTVTLWVNGRKVSLSEWPDFRDRVVSLPPDSQIVLYSGTTPVPPVMRAPSTRPSEPEWRPWPDVMSAAVGAVMSPTAVSVTTSARLIGEPRPEGPSEPPLEALLKLPPSTLVAWTRPIRYEEGFRQIVLNHPDGVVPFYIHVLQSELPAGTIETRLLPHLVGDTILMIGQRLRPATQPAATGDLLLPTLSLAVETDDPDGISAVLVQMTENLLRLLNLQPPGSGPLAISEISMGPQGPLIRSLPLGRFLASYSMYEILDSVEISWSVADRWLIIATHPDIVREMIEVRRGQSQPMAAGHLEQAVARVRAGHAKPHMVLLARPRATAGMIETWLRYINTHHPELRRPEWWQSLRRQQLTGGIQLGLVPGPTTQPGVVVDHTLPGWPAHGRLQAGDRITRVDGSEVDPKNSLESLRRLLTHRQRPDVVSLELVRNGEALTIHVQMTDPADEDPPLDPIKLLTDLAELLQVFSSASFVTWQPSPGKVNTRLELELAEPPAATQPFATQPSSTQPSATQSTAAQPAATAPSSTRPVAVPAAPITQPASAPAGATLPAADLLVPVTPAASAPAEPPVSSTPASAPATTPADR